MSMSLFDSSVCRCLSDLQEFLFFFPFTFFFSFPSLSRASTYKDGGLGRGEGSKELDVESMNSDQKVHRNRAGGSWRCTEKKEEV